MLLVVLLLLLIALKYSQIKYRIMLASASFGIKILEVLGLILVIKFIAGA